MTRETFIYGLNGCAVTYHNGQKLYEHDDLVKCFEDLGIFEQDPKADVLDKIRAEIEKLADDEWNKQVGSVSQGLEDAIEIIDKYKTESEVRNANSN